MPDSDIDLQKFMTGVEKDSSYNLCVLGSVAIGAAVGAATATPIGILAGAAAGGAIGLKLCPSLAPAIRKKLFSANERMTPAEFGLMVRQVRVAYPQLDRQQVLDLITRERRAVIAEARC